jgi:hypothetical protein
VLFAWTTLSGGLTAAGAPDWLQAIAKGLGSGVQAVATFIPIIARLFLFFSFLEDCGYMARAAFGVDMSYMGDVGAAAAKLEVSSRVFEAMQTRFDGAVCSSCSRHRA